MKRAFIIILFSDKPCPSPFTMLKLATLLPLLALFKSAFGQDRILDWFLPYDPPSYDDITMYAKDTLTFNYTGNHDVYIHPTGNCAKDDGIFVGAQFAGSASYTFKDSEIDTTVTFACDYLNHCTFGMNINVLVLEPPPSAAPSQAPSVSTAPSTETTPAPTAAPAPSQAPSVSVSTAPSMETTPVPTVAPAVASTDGDGDDKEPSAVAPAQGTLLAFFVAAFAMLM
jgi:hypothetical protein